MTPNVVYLVLAWFVSGSIGYWWRGRVEFDRRLAEAAAHDAQRRTAFERELSVALVRHDDRL
jgi:hypothetical protein